MKPLRFGLQARFLSVATAAMLVVVAIVAAVLMGQATTQREVLRASNEVVSKVEGGVTNVRLKTYAEVKARFDAAGRFLVMPGQEITQTVSAPEA